METSWILGPNPLDSTGTPPAGTWPATLHLGYERLVTVPGTHFMQISYLRTHLDAARTAAGKAPISDAEWEAHKGGIVILYHREGCLEIPIPRNTVDLVFQADEFLQHHGVAKYQIRFLSVSDPRFREEIRRRGELWRITPRPEGWKAMTERLRNSRTAIQQGTIYYYNPFQGTRYLTAGDFAALAKLSDAELAAQLAEIAEYLPKMNRQGEPELRLWPKATPMLSQQLTRPDWTALDGEALRNAFEAARENFEATTGPSLLQSEAKGDPWRETMYRTLTREPAEPVELCQPDVLGPEFLYHIEWLPGARIDRRECILDSLFGLQSDPRAMQLCNPTVRELILNQVREYTDLEFVNVGRISEPLGPHPQMQGRREVFLMEMKRASHPQPDLRVIRFQKWGIREHLKAGKDIGQAYDEVLEYLEYSANRRLACQQLGMNLPRRVSVHVINEGFHTRGAASQKGRLPAFYSERAFIEGVPTHRLGSQRMKEEGYALAVAGLLGSAAAINLIVARGDEHTGKVVFDEGDEVIRHDKRGTPMELVTCDHSGSFALHQHSLEEMAPAYAEPVNRLTPDTPGGRFFAERYLAAFRERLERTRQEFLDHEDHYRRLFANLARDPGGNFAHRWDCLLDKLKRAEARELVPRVRAGIRV